MLPQAAGTNRYGDLLKEFYSGLKDGSLSEARLDEIQRIFNELWDREDKYKQMFADNRIRLERPIIREPDFRSSPLHTLTCYRFTDVSISDNTFTAITFEDISVPEDTSVFSFFGGNRSKIAVERALYANAFLEGYVRWESNATGGRVVRLNYYSEAGVSLSTNEISVIQAVSAAGFPTVQPFTFTDPLYTFTDPKPAYVTLEVKQSSGGSLLVEQLIMSVSQR